MKRWAATLEVTVVTALTWAAYKTMKLVEPGGFNCSPGLAMILVASIMLFLRWREFGTYGIAPAGWRWGLNLGVAFSLLMLLGGAAELAVFPLIARTPANWPFLLAFGVTALRILIYLVFFFLLIRMQWRRSVERVPPACSLSLLAALLIAAPAFAASRGAPPANAAGLAAALVFCTGLGEELFFRGYVQSHLNGVFGRPWRFLSASFGPGLFISSLLFGFIHILNPTKPWEGHWEISWLWGVLAFLGGLLYGWMRELTGGIWSAAIVHALSGEYRGLWQVFLQASSL